MPGHYRGELNHLSQTKRIENLLYPPENMSTVSLKHLPSGRTIIGRNPEAGLSKSAAQEAAAKNAWSQIKNIERQMGIAEITSKS